MLGPAGGLRLPNFLMPKLMSNHGNYIVSLGNVCRWLAAKAEALGVEIYPGFAASVFFALFGSGPIDQDPPHSFARRGKKISLRNPVATGMTADESKVGFMNQAGRIKGLAWLFLL
jgi:hypothetical protein